MQPTLKNIFLTNRTKSAVVPAVVEKCLSSTRAGTKAKALDLILLYVEVDTPDPVIVSTTTTIKGAVACERHSCSGLAETHLIQLTRFNQIGRCSSRIGRQTAQTCRNNNKRTGCHRSVSLLGLIVKNHGAIEGRH